MFLTYRGRAEIEALSPAVLATEPLYDFTAPDGVRHTVWRISDPGPWIEAFREVPHAYVADGHHRSASAWRAGKERRAGQSRAPGGRGVQLVSRGAVSRPISSAILPYNRVVRDLGGKVAARGAPGAATSRPGLADRRSSPASAGDVLRLPGWCLVSGRAP